MSSVVFLPEGPKAKFVENNMPALAGRARQLKHRGGAVTDRGPISSLLLDDVREASSRHGVPVEDALLIALNLCGIASDQNRHRARVTVSLASRPDPPWMIIVPLNASASPFRLHEDELTLGEDVIATVRRIDADEAVGGYFRDEGRAATLNPNARSRCVGCAFCPNTLEASADPRLSDEQEMGDLLHALVEQHPRRNLSELREVTVSTGCYEREEAAVGHLIGLRKALTDNGIGARLGFLTSVVHSTVAFDALARAVAPFVLRLTVECFTRRPLLLKSSKAMLSFNAMPQLLQRAEAAGLDTSFTYVVGLDSLEDLRTGVAQLASHVTEFPNFQVYQAHNSIMAALRAPGADQLEFYLQARAEIEEMVGPSGLRPTAWECYRPLWYFTFGDELLVGG